MPPLRCRAGSSWWVSKRTSAHAVSETLRAESAPMSDEDHRQHGRESAAKSQSIKWVIPARRPRVLQVTGAFDYLRDTVIVRTDVGARPPRAHRVECWNTPRSRNGRAGRSSLIATMVLFTNPSRCWCVLGSAGGMAFGFCSARYLAA
ncbi:MAG: hypothetical protein IPI43_32480 [Sandaracinaceae bacterium]|nr:hypothetical protein [Sandaracinaceae bacterium]